MALCGTPDRRLNVPALEQSFNGIIKRHEACEPPLHRGRASQCRFIAPTRPLASPCADISALPRPNGKPQRSGLIQVEALHPFDLENGTLLQVRLLRLGEQEHILLLTMHHIISDGGRGGVLLHELAVLYDAFCQGKPSPLPDLPVQYAGSCPLAASVVAQ